VSAKPKVIVAPHRRRMAEIFTPEDEARLRAGFEVIWGKDEPMSPALLADALPGALATVSMGWPFGDVLARADTLRAIVDVGGGFPNGLDYDACFARGIRVLTAAPAFGPQVAEMALGMVLAASREIVAGDAAMRRGDEKWLHAGNESTFLLYGKPVGFIGYGGLARALRPLLAPFGCPISVYDPWLPEGYLRSQGVEPVSLEALLEGSRVTFVLAVPSAENRALLSRDMLERIPPGSVLALISRAHLVDFDALTELVLAGRFKAVIDVFPNEPLPLDHPIRRAPGVVLSAHRAGSVAEGLQDIGRLVVDDLEAIARGIPPLRLQVAQPELFGRYASTAAPRPPAR
jgi:phosphoglycerate dehydrogenase-like enzyme